MNNNILYIAPYKQININGILSLFILVNLIKSRFNITARPIFLNNSATLDFINNDIERIEKTKFNYDTVIQVTSPNECVKINKSSIKNNILIPILNEEILSEDSISRISQFDKVLVDTKSKYNALSSLDKKLSSKLYTYDYTIPINIDSNNTFNLGALSKTKKIYTIVDANNNITNIYNLCCSFLKNILYREYSLNLYVYNIDQNLKNTLDNLISKIYSGSEIKYSINRIILIPIEPNLDSIVTAHTTGSIFIDLENSSLNTKLAELLKNPVIYFNNEDYNFEMHRNNQLRLEGYNGLKSKSIDLKINQLLNGSIEPQHQFKKTDISKII